MITREGRRERRGEERVPDLRWKARNKDAHLGPRLIHLIIASLRLRNARGLIPSFSIIQDTITGLY